MNIIPNYHRLSAKEKADVDWYMTAMKNSLSDVGHLPERSKPMLTRIHVNQHVIKANAKHGKCDPVFTVKQGKSNTYAHRVKVLGEMELVYRPDKPLSCGAKVWIETRGEVQCELNE